MLLTTLLASGQAPSPEQEILTLTRQYNQAWESLDVEAISPYHANDIIYYWHGRKGPSSKTEFEALLRQLLPSMSSYSHHMIDPQVQLIGEEVAVVSHEVDGEYRSKDGELSNYDGALTYVFQKIEGQWKIILIHESAATKKLD